MSNCYRLHDPVPVRLQKLGLCVMIAQSFDPATADAPPVPDLILDHLCQVAGMKEVALAQKSSRNKFDRVSMAAFTEVACRAIEAIENIGTGTHQKQHDTQQQHSITTVPSSSQPRAVPRSKSTANALEVKEQRDRGLLKCCLDRLFQLLVFFSSMEHVSEESRKEDRDGSGGSTWMNTDIAELGLDDSQVALLLSTVLTAIESKDRNWRSFHHFDVCSLAAP
jgi:hypothetical protein